MASSSNADKAKLQEHKPDSSTLDKEAEKQAITLEEDDEFEDFPADGQSSFKESTERLR